jgi:hypothetical protein
MAVVTVTSILVKAGYLALAIVLVVALAVPVYVAAVCIDGYNAARERLARRSG